jgi:hypothetical protein
LDGQSTILWSKDDADEESEEEKAISRKRKLSEFPSVKDKTRLKVYDLLQNQTIIITLKQEKVDKNTNEGLFYKFKITSGELEEKKGEEGEEGVDKEKEGPETLTMESKVTEDQDLAADRVQDISDDSVPADKEMVTETSAAGEEVMNQLEEEEDDDDDDDVIFVPDDDDEAVIVSDGDEDDSCDIIEVREKRKTEDLESDEEEDEESRAKRRKV